MIKRERYTATHLDTDSAPDKRDNTSYFAAFNLEVVNNGRTLSINPTKTKGIFESGGPTYLNTIVGHVVVNDLLYLFEYRGFGTYRDIIHKVTKTGNITEIVKSDWGWSDATQLDVVGNRENEDIIKVYWADGTNQLRTLNLVDPDLYDGMNADIVLPVELSKPTAEIIQGGNLIAGKVQYAYSLFNLHGIESVVSALSAPLSISLNMEGGESAEVMPLSAEVDITGIDTTFEYIRVYSIHYQEVNQVPKITLIYETQITGTTLTVIDDGNLFISELSSEQFKFLGGVVLKPTTIAIKDNRLFAANYQTTNFDIPHTSQMDSRVFSYDNGTPEFGIKQAGGSEEKYVNPAALWVADPDGVHDAINYDYDIYKYQSNGATPGAEGTNFKLGFNTTTTVDKDTRSLKQGEIYRIGVVYRDQYNRATPVKWMCDLKIPYYTPGTAVFIDCQFNNASVFYTLGVRSFQLVIVKREPKDRSVSSPGFIVPGATFEWSDSSEPATGYTHPYYTLKRLFDFATTANGGYLLNDYTPSYDYDTPAGYVVAEPIKNDDIQFFYSSDTVFDIENMYPVSQAHILGTARTGIPFIAGETKISYFKDGGPDNTLVVSTGLQYQLYNSLVPDMPDFLMYHSAVASPTSLFTFEVTMFHKYLQYEVMNPTDYLVNDKKSLTDSTPLKRLESDVGNKVSNILTIKDALFRDSGNERNTSIDMGFAGCMVLFFEHSDWHVSSGGGGDYSIFKPVGTITTTIHLPLIELLRTITNQYGGSTYEDKNRNNYLLNGPVVKTSNGGGGVGVSNIELGDVYIGPLIVNRVDGLNTQKQAYWNNYEYVSIGNVEHNVDIYSRNDDMYEWYQGLDVSTLYGLFRLEDNHKLLGAYNQQNELILGISKPATFSTVENFEASIIASKQKFPNEVIDSWTDFLVNETIDLIGTYGSITKLYNFTNEIFSFQERAVSAITINPRIQIQADDGIGVELGTGTILYNYKYLTTKSGTSDMWSVTDDSISMYYYDDVSNSINIHTGEEFSTTKKIRNLMSGVINYGIVRSIYDIGKEDVLFSFGNKTIVYNKYIGGFTRTENEHEYLHAFNNKIYSIVSDNLYAHYIGTDYNLMNITYLLAPMPTMDKVFHNIEYRKVGDNNFNSIEAEDTIGRTGIAAPPTIYNKFNINRIHIPRVTGGMERFRDVNILLTLQSPQSADGLWVDDMVLMYNIKG